MICGVPSCCRPGTAANYGVCSAHRREELAPGALMEELENQRTDADLEEQRPIHIAAVPLRWQPLGGSPYGRAVLASQLEKVASTAPGERNQTLNRIAYLIGGYVAGGEIDMEVAAHGLLVAAAAAKIPAGQARATIRSGMRKGFAKPVVAPSR